MGTFDDPAFLALLAGLLGFFFLVYLFVRRTLLSFREGIDSGQNRSR